MCDVVYMQASYNGKHRQAEQQRQTEKQDLEKRCTMLEQQLQATTTEAQHADAAWQAKLETLGQQLQSLDAQLTS